MAPQRHHHFYGIDALRFVAAVLVLLNHFGTYALSEAGIADDHSIRAYGFLDPFVGIGAVGVEIFFVISGFVISMSAASLSGVAGGMRFALSRATRILPALWISGAISIIALLLAGSDLQPLIERFARSAVLSPVGPYIDGVVWSLVVEAVFYLVVGLAICLCPPPMRLERVALVIGTLSTVYLLVFSVVTVAEYRGASETLARFPFKVFLLRHGVFFAVGMLIWANLRHGPKRAGRFALPLFVAMGVIEIWLSNYPSVARASAGIIIWLLAMAWLEYSTRAGQPPPRARELLRFMGNMSYPLYLNHYTTGMVVVFLLNRQGLDAFLSFTLSLCIVFLISFSVLMAETGFRSRLRRSLRNVRGIRRPANIASPADLDDRARSEK